MKPWDLLDYWVQQHGESHPLTPTKMLDFVRHPEVTKVLEFPDGDIRKCVKAFTKLREIRESLETGGPHECQACGGLHALPSDAASCVRNPSPGTPRVSSRNVHKNHGGERKAKPIGTSELGEVGRAAIERSKEIAARMEREDLEERRQARRIASDKAALEQDAKRKKPVNPNWTSPHSPPASSTDGKPIDPRYR